MQKRTAIDNCLKPYKFSLDGHLMINLGTEKKPKWFPTDDMEYLKKLADAAYEQGFEEAKRIQRSKDIVDDSQNIKLNSVDRTKSEMNL